jgi:murein DD-endopeptidase MepM/ murein hydrolase activator NlpD
VTTLRPRSTFHHVFRIDTFTSCAWAGRRFRPAPTVFDSGLDVHRPSGAPPVYASGTGYLDGWNLVALTATEPATS